MFCLVNSVHWKLLCCYALKYAQLGNCPNPLFKPCKDLSVDMPSLKKSLSCPKRSPCCLQLHCFMWQSQEGAQTMSCWLSTGLNCSQAPAQLWPFQQAVFKTKLWQSCGVARVSAPSRHYRQEHTGLAPSPSTVLQHHPGKPCTLRQACMTSHHAIPQHVAFTVGITWTLA